MKEFINKNLKTILILSIVILISVVGITVAYNASDINIALGTGEYNVVYTGATTLPSAKLQPLMDDEVLDNPDNHLSISFTVKGAETNPTGKDIIYDVSLTNLTMPKELRSEYLKWMLYKNGTKISEGNFSSEFDMLENRRMVLTNIQQDLPSYSETPDEYRMYIWISESCTSSDITNCTVDMDQSYMSEKSLSGEVRIELSTGSKKELVRVGGVFDTTSAFTTLANLGLENEINEKKLTTFTSSSLQADNNLGVCTYNGNKLLDDHYSNNVLITSGCDSSFYEFASVNGEKDYYSSEYYTENEYVMYTGESGTWDETNQICTYIIPGEPADEEEGSEGSEDEIYTVYDYKYNEITSEANCGKIYDIEGEFYSMITEMPADNLVFESFPGKTGIYESEDDIGISYYFRGNPTNNYVIFGKYPENVYRVYDSSTGITTYAPTCTTSGTITCSRIAYAGDNIYWRIVRINGDGAIRMMYSGTAASSKASIGNVPFNKNYDDNAYVGYMYGASGQSTYEATHANTNNSTVKIAVDAWYEKYLNTNYSTYIADAIYCNDRSLSSGTGIGTTDTNYGIKGREEYGEGLASLKTITPTLKCKQKNDRFTINNSSIQTSDEIGTNQSLKYPIGLITSDEAFLAGGYDKANSSYYLYKAVYYWTMTANSFMPLISPYTAIRVIQSDGRSWSSIYAQHSYSVYPVISIKADVLKSGSGTSTDPFLIWESGDINKDGVVTQSDLDLLEQFLVDEEGEIEFDSEQLALADIDKDGDITDSDAEALQEII